MKEDDNTLYTVLMYERKAVQPSASMNIFFTTASTGRG